MPKESILTKPINNARVSPYPLRSSRTKKYDPFESLFNSEWEDVQCVICQESPHNAVLLLCTSCPTGCRPYMCDTSARHSNCYKQFCKSNNKKKNLTDKTLDCPLCRGEVFDTTKVMRSARRFMNAKPRPCPFDDCEFVGTYSQLDKHLKTGHPGPVPPKIDPVRQERWEQIERHEEYVGIMQEVAHYQLSNTLHPPMLQVNVNRIAPNFSLQVVLEENMSPRTMLNLSL